MEFQETTHEVLERHAPPTVTAPVRRTGDEWEAIVGGNWLNKAGVIVFVIGLSLFLGYSLTRFGPLGRVAIGWAVSIALLGAGVVLERKPQYVLFARGLVAGGWAGCYFTAFAMYALPAARVIESPVAGTLVLLAVAGAMIAHSLRYKSETVTALTYFIGFATLNIAPLSSFSLFASAPLAVSLLAISYRHQWSPISVLGVIFTYGSFLMRMATSTAPASQSDLTIAQSILALYWILFETFDLLEVRRERESDVLRTLFPLNAAGLIGTSMLLWGDRPGSSLYVLYALTAVAYLVSSVIRAKLQPSAGLADTDTLQRAWSGGYEGAITAAAALAAVAIGLRFSGIRLTAGLMLEGEFLLLSGLRLNTRYLRGLASVVLLASFAMSLPILFGPSPNIFRSWDSWIPIALVMAIVFHINRVLGRGHDLVLAEPLYSTLGTALIVIVVGQATPLRFLGLAWLIPALALTELSIRFDVDDLRRQAYAVAALAAIAFSSLISSEIVDARSWTLATGAAMALLLAARVSRPAGTVGDDERIFARSVASWGATTLAAIAIWYAVPHQYAGIAWLLLAWPLLEIGLSMWRECLVQAALLGAAAVSQILATTQLGIGPVGSVHPSLVLAAAGTLGAAAAIRLFAFGDVKRPEQIAFRDPCALIGIVCLALLAWQALPAPIVVLAWGGFGLILIEAGHGVEWPFLENSGHALTLVAFCRLFFANFTATDGAWGISTRLLTSLPLVPLFYYLAQSVHGRQSSGVDVLRRGILERLYIWMAPIVVAVLMRFELGRVFTASGWAVFGLALLVLAVKRRDVDYRIQSYILSGAAFSRGWTTNFEAPGVFGGVSLELAVAAIVIASLYASEFVVPRFWHDRRSTPEAGEPNHPLLLWVDLHARELFSIFATILLGAVLFHDVPAGLLTVAWAMQGLVLLAAGFSSREAILRRSGLVLLGVCLVKVLGYDSRQLETLARILSFMLLGAVLIVVSWIYTRFGLKLRQYL